MQFLLLSLLTITRKKLAGLAKMKNEFREFGKYKTCRTCKKERLRSSFYPHPNYKDKATATCKFCVADKAKGIEIVPEPKSVQQRIREYFYGN